MSDIRSQFDQVSAAYNRQRRGFIPCYDHFYDIPVTVADAGTETPRVLDIGAGTGLLTEHLMTRYPKGTYTLIDLSDRMLDQARSRFAGRHNVSYITGDYVTHPLEGPFDLIVSALSIHHLPDEQKQELYRKCHNLLRPGGLLINADQVRGETPYLESLSKRVWWDQVAGSGLTEEEIRAGRERTRLDREAGLDEQLSWLRDAGFSDAGCVYRYFVFAVLLARRPED